MTTTKVHQKKLQKSLQDYLPKIRRSPAPLNPLPSKNWILSGCKHPKTRSFAIDRKGDDAEDVNDDGSATLADVDRFMFENFKSLYLKDDPEDGEILSRGAGKGQDEGERRASNDVALLDSPRLIYPPLNLRGSKRFFVSPGWSGSLLEEARSSLTTSGSSSTSLTANTVSAAITSAMDPATKDETPPVEGVKLPDDCIAVIKKTQCPYRDFKRSMQDMAELRLGWAVDWEFMEELLFCYLRLNDRESHKYIIRAFVDLVVALLGDSNNRVVTSSSRDLRSNNNNNGRLEGRNTRKG